jgi:hypothetical protein
MAGLGPGPRSTIALGHAAPRAAVAADGREPIAGRHALWLCPAVALMFAGPVIGSPAGANGAGGIALGLAAYACLGAISL